MARNLRSIGPAHNSGTPEKPYFDRLVAIETHIKQLREDRKEVCIEAKEADIFVGALKHRVKRHLESEEARLARETLEAESERIGRALGEFVNTPLGEAAVDAAQREEPSRRRRRSTSGTVTLDPAQEGRNAAEQGLPESHNPFYLGSLESAVWMTNYRNARDQWELAKGAADSPYEDDPKE